jgi:hypothetical protein
MLDAMLVFEQSFHFETKKYYIMKNPVAVDAQSFFLYFNYGKITGNLFKKN